MIDRIKTHYSFTNPATVHDEEALTTLELVGRTAYKVNEVVEDQNTLREETENHLEEQDNRITKMNDVTMPSKVEEEVEKHIQNGDFDRAIDVYAGELEARLNNFMENTPEGSTTMDAEVIDGRLGFKNTPYGNIGTAIRKSCIALDENTNFLRDTIYSIFAGPVAKGTIVNQFEQGTYIWSAADDNFIKSPANHYARSMDKIPVSNGDEIVYDDATYEVQLFYFDENGRAISTEWAGASPYTLRMNVATIVPAVCYKGATSSDNIDPASVKVEIRKDATGTPVPPKLVSNHQVLLFEQGTYVYESNTKSFVPSAASHYVRTCEKLPISNGDELVYDDATYDVQLFYWDAEGVATKTEFAGPSPYKIPYDYAYVIPCFTKKGTTTSDTLRPLLVWGYLRKNYVNSMYNNFLHGDVVCVEAGNYNTLLPDANKVKGPAMFKLLFGKGSTAIPTGLPFNSWPGGVGLMLCGVSKDGSYQTQVLFTLSGVYYRYSGSYEDFAGWSDLSRIGVNEAPYLTVTSGGSILATLKQAYNQGIKKVVVEAGTYDILDEYKAYYGSTYFDTYVAYGSADKFDRGLWLEDMELVFSPGATVNCHYTGSNKAVTEYFSPISTGNNVIIDGLRLRATNLRYGIHSDFNTGSDRTYMVIRNCDLEHTRGNTCKCIGAGFGKCVDWIIENNIFRVKTPECVFSVHNYAYEGAQSTLTVKDCYVENGGFFTFTGHGPSTKETLVKMTGCSYTVDPITNYIEGGQDNVTLIAWNNEKR